MIRAARGAATVERDDPEQLCAVTRTLLSAIVERNRIGVADLVSVMFTVTDDLRSDFPARAARELGWLDVPLLCAREIPVPGSLPRCVRVLLHFHTTRARSGIVHVYLGLARSLRPDLAGGDDYFVPPDEAGA